MAYIETVQPRGLVLRWDDGGTINGRVCFVTIGRNDGVVRLTEDGAEMAVADAAAAGFPLADAIAYLQAALPSS